jgi:hypothetical protein
MVGSQSRNQRMDNSVATLVGATIGGLAALLGGLVSGPLARWLDSKWFSPRLEIDFGGHNSPYVIESSYVEGDKSVTEFYVRVRIRNSGSRIAKSCRVYLLNIEEVHGDKVVETSYHDSLQLPWPLDDRDARDIPSGVNFFADVVGVRKDSPGWRIKTGTLYASHAGLYTYKGIYWFTILVSGDGVKPARRKIQVTYNQDWHTLKAIDHGP